MEVQTVARSTTAMILAVSMLAAACGSGGDGGEATGAGGDPDAHIRVNMTEYGFGSDVIEVRAGQTVEFLLKNSGDLDHEFMIGREVTVGMDGMATGFGHDFFEGLMPTVDPPDDTPGVTVDHPEAGMVMESMEIEMDMDGHDHDHVSMETDVDGHDDSSMETDLDGHDDGSMETDTDGHDDGHHGFMVTLGPGATASVTVAIPDDAVGDWEIGCFRDKGSHWSSGMHATLRIRA